MTALEIPMCSICAGRCIGINGEKLLVTAWDEDDQIDMEVCPDCISLYPNLKTEEDLQWGVK